MLEIVLKNQKVKNHKGKNIITSNNWNKIFLKKKEEDAVITKLKKKRKKIEKRIKKKKNMKNSKIAAWTSLESRQIFLYWN